MSWDAVAAIGQVVSALALVFVILQIRHARSESRRALSQGRGEALRGLMAWSGEQGISKIRTKIDEALGVQVTPAVGALMERAGLTRDEAVRVTVLQTAYWEYRAQIIPVVDELSEIERSHFDTALVAAYGQRGWARWFYETRRLTAHPEMVRYIENVLARPT